MPATGIPRVFPQIKPVHRNEVLSGGIVENEVKTTLFHPSLPSFPSPSLCLVLDSVPPPVLLWAQRSDRVYLTIGLPDAKDVAVKCEPEGMVSFQVHLKLYGTINPERNAGNVLCPGVSLYYPAHGSRTKIGLRNIVCSIQKENKSWWKRLLRSEEKPLPTSRLTGISGATRMRKSLPDSEDEGGAGCGDDDDEYEENGDDGESSDDNGLLYLPDLEKLG
ncbi:unnamed protein product [Spirodela intermedia]|uniref:Co-chaperone protein p23 n=1 Tax=Spirodela intermedia TaxID=51605 RepID=A0A7I8JU35_SPIIN|nr:unnamed protein product [Spirodela intermedia]CAA6673686.1 unnamed protein product [Spirodela intermedia]